MNGPNGVSADVNGNVYIADFGNQRIRKINPAGIVSTFAGTGTAGYNGDGNAATSAQLCYPIGVSADINGNVYIADRDNNRIRMVNFAGIIATFAGIGTAGSSGDDGLAISAQLNHPYGVAADISGNVYIVDLFNSRIRKVNSAGIITAFAGTGVAGYNGDGVLATLAQLNNPWGVSADISGNVYIADQWNHRIRKVNSAGIVTTFAGTGTDGYNGDGFAATSAQLRYPSGLSADINGNVYIADTGNSMIRKVNSAGIITTLAGTGIAGYNGDGDATSAQLNNPYGVSADMNGNVYIADPFNERIRFVVISPQPVARPMMLPSCQPSLRPSRQPSNQPTMQPSQQPSSQPSGTGISNARNELQLIAERTLIYFSSH